MSQPQGLILNWTGSVNQKLDQLTGSLTTDIVYAHNNANDTSKISIFEAEAYALYKALTATDTDGPGWAVVSSSCYNYNTDTWGVNTTGWASIDEVRMPMAMSSNDQITENYTPTSHSWVTLKYIHAGNNEETYLTIDCRYPTPPHKTSISYGNDYTADRIDDISIADKSTGQTIKKFMAIGPSSVKEISYGELDRGASDSNLYDPTLTAGGNNNSEYKPRINCSFDDFKGIARRDTTTSFQTWNLDGSVLVGYHDYSSRVVGFIDIVVSNKPPSSGVNYGTVSTRPMFGEVEDENVIHCWALDYIRNGHTVGAALPDADLKKYRYHINWVHGVPVFMFGISKNTSTNSSDKKDFISLYGISNVANGPTADKYTFAPTAINCDISRNTNRSDGALDWYNLDYSYCINNNGNSIEYIFQDATSKISVENNTINNFFNTCFRNYNFKKDQSSSETIRKGASTFSYPYFGDSDLAKATPLPVFAPVSPGDATVCSLALRTPQAFMNSSNAGYKVLGPNQGSVYQHYEISPGGTKQYWWTLQTASVQDIGFSTIATNPNRAELKLDLIADFNYNNAADYGVDKKAILFRAAGYSNNYTATTIKAEVKGIHLNSVIVGGAYTLKTTSVPTANTIKGLFPYHYLDDSIMLNTYGYTPQKDGEFTAVSAVNLDNDLNTSVQATADDRISLWNNRFNRATANTSYKILQDITDYILNLTASGKFGYEPATTCTKTLSNVANVTQIGTWNGFKFKNNTSENPKFSYRTTIPIPFLTSSIGSTVLNLDAPNNPSLDTANQHNGVDAFSVFKSLVYKGNTNFSYEVPLVALKYSFSNKDIKDNFDVYGVHNKLTNNANGTNLEGDTTDNLNKILTSGNKAYDNSYTEMPIFLMSARSDYASVKGYVTDIYWVPTDIGTQVIDIDNDGTKSKIIWRGWSMPWISPDEME